MSRKLVCIGNGPVMSFTPYMAKLALTLKSMNIDVKFITWKRKQDYTTAKDPDNISQYCLLHSGMVKLPKMFLVLTYIYWMIKLFVFILFSKDRYYFCSRFENCFPVWLASKFRSINYIYADRDSLFSTYSWPRPLKALIKSIESKIATSSFVHLIPGHSRNFTGNDNVEVVQNLPASWTLSKSIEIAKSRKSNCTEPECLCVYLNGWLAPTRGRKHIINAISNVAISDRVKFIVAGDFDQDFSDAISDCTNVHMLGRLSNEEALSYYYSSDIVVSLYDPSIEINVKAEPNKWWDCVFTNTPFVTNYGIETLSGFEGLVPFYQIDYQDEMSLSQFIETISLDPKYKRNKEFTQDVNYPYWDEKVENIISKFLEEV